MENEVIMPQPRKPWFFLIPAALTVLVGAGLAMAAIIFLQPAPVMEPGVRIIREKSKPEVIVKEVVKEVIKEVIKEVPVTPVATSVQSNAWEGIWRLNSAELPMFKLKEAKGMVTGVYAAPNGTVLPIRGGKVMDDAVEVVVDDSLFIVRFRLAMAHSSAMNVTMWITDEDWLISLARANKRVKTPQDALIARGQLQENVKLTRKHASLGTFYRGTEN